MGNQSGYIEESVSDREAGRWVHNQSYQIDLSAEAFAVWQWLRSHKSKFKISHKMIAEFWRFGRDKTQRVVNELKEQGCVKITRVRDVDGIYRKWKWQIFAVEDMTDYKKRAKPVNRTTENTGYPYTENQGYGTTENTGYFKDSNLQKSKHIREETESDDSLPTPKAIEPKQEALITQTVENTENNEGRSVPLDSDIVTVFDSWMRLHPGRQFKLNDKKRGHIRARLKTFSVSEIQEALHKLSQDAWHSERGKFDFEYCFRRDEQIEKFLSFRINGKSKPTTAADVRAMEAKYAVIKPLKSDEES